MAPADPGGGWDTTARVMSQAMTQSKAVDKGIEVYNVPGAAGRSGSPSSPPSRPASPTS
jgi:putative tricarboxylic transport membrane protein